MKRLLVVTDLDGSLLDNETYSYEAAQEALDALRHHGVPLVLCSSKTRSEMEPLAHLTGAPSPLIVESGGALLLPRGLLDRPPRHLRREEDFFVLELGEPRKQLVAALSELARETGARVRGFAGFSLDQLQDETGLSPVAALRAQERAYDEPFLLDTPELESALQATAGRWGLLVSRGGRFHHLTGRHDKGRALSRLLELWAEAGQRFATVGLGDAANDLPMLRVVERAILVPRQRDGVDPVLRDALPEAECAPWPGPRGWNAAVLAVLEGKRLEGRPQ